MINNIQVLRAFAAINVVLFHIIGIASTYSQNVYSLQLFKSWGANGVDIFFVISGFVALYTQMSRRKTTTDFLKTRFIRIIPIYWLLTLSVIFLFYLAPDIFRTITLSPLWILSSLFFMSQPLMGTDPIVYVGWTLEWEMLFYIIFSLSLIARTWLFLLLLVNTFVLLISLITGNSIIMEFLLGLVIAYIVHQKTYPPLWGFIILLIGIFFLSLSLFPGIQVLQINRFIIWGIPSFLIVIGSIYAWQLNNRLLLFLGDASYSIYLIQMFTIPAFYKASSKVMSGINGDVLAISCLAFCLLISCLFYKYIEKPITNYLRKFI